MEFTCNFCDRTFETDHGRGIHAGKMHKEDMKKDNLTKEKGILKCKMCELVGSSNGGLTGHMQQEPIEEVKRKIIKEQPIKCYICGFQSSSETAFQIHTEEKHDQKYYIQKEKSVTKSPPTKKVKEHHDVDMDTDTLEIVRSKDEEITDLKSTINLLKQNLQNIKDDMLKGGKPSEYTLKHINEDISEIDMVPVPTITEYPCEKCGHVFQSEHLKEDHTTKCHKEALVEKPPVRNTISCGCKYPCILVNIQVEAQGVTPKRLHTQQDTQVNKDKDILQEKEVLGEQPETWQLVGGAGRPKYSICGKTRNTKNAMEKHMKDHEED